MKKIVSILLLIMWLYFIYSMSSSSGSVSTRESSVFVAFIMNLFHIENKYLITLLVRKLAHFIEYFILGLFTVNCFNAFNKRKILYISLFCLLVAILDECHQLYVPGRSFGYIDIMIDFIGSYSSIYLLKLLHIIKYE